MTLPRHTGMGRPVVTNLEEDFTNYVQARYPTLLRSALMLGCSLPDAEDLVQRVLVRCFSKWRAIRAARNPDAYIYTMLVNAHRDDRRRFWHREVPTDDVASRMSGTEELDDGLTHEGLAEALRSIPKEQRATLVLRFIADLDVKETAVALGVSEGTVKSRTSRALSALRDLIENDFCEVSKP